jgi:glycosyltransferase involved in cell wall biosynthesis
MPESQQANAVARPRMSAVVCTRNRGDSVRLTVSSLLRNSHPEFEVIVIDQSTNEETAQAIESLRRDPRFRYVRSTTVGVARSRNQGLRIAHGELVAFTDDDCEVPEDWLEILEQVILAHSRVAVAFCSVRAGPHDPSRGFVPAYDCRGTRIVGSMLEKCTARGMGAGLVVRRRSVLALGGFDEALGPGARFPSCEEGDLAVRALLAGHQVCETDRTFTVHHGFRSWAEGKDLAQRDWTGIGAAYAKPIKAGHLSFTLVPLYELLRMAIWPPLSDLMRLRRPRGVRRALYFCRGFSEGLATPLDRGMLLFR